MRRTPLKRTGFQRKPRRDAPPPPRKIEPDPIKSSTRRLLSVRSGNLCEIGLPGCTKTGVQAHHRKLRRHGDHSVENLIHACAVCHQAIHSSQYGITSWENGWLVRSTLDPAKQKWLSRSGWVLDGKIVSDT